MSTSEEIRTDAHVLDPLSRTQLEQLTAIGDALLTRLDPEDRFGARADAGHADAH